MHIMDNKFYFLKLMLDASTLERNSEYQRKKELWLQNIEGDKNRLRYFP
jgi:hypothetical protein